MQNKKILAIFLVYICVWGMITANEKEIFIEPIAGFKTASKFSRDYQSHMFKISHTQEKVKVSGQYFIYSFEKRAEDGSVDDKFNSEDVLSFYHNLAKANEYEVKYISDDELVLKSNGNWFEYIAKEGYYEIHYVQKKEFEKIFTIDFGGENELDDIFKISGFTLKKKEKSNFSSYDFPIRKEFETLKTKKIKGRYVRLYFEKINETKKLDYNFSYEEILKNFKEAILDINGKIVFENEDQMVFQIENRWGHVLSGNGMYTINVIEENEFERKLFFDTKVEKLSDKLRQGINDFKLTAYRVEKNYLYNYYVGKGNYRKVKGKYYEYKFENLRENGTLDKKISGEEIQENYKIALSDLNFEIVASSKSEIIFKKGNFWIALYTEPGYAIIKFTDESDRINKKYTLSKNLDKKLNNDKKIFLKQVKFVENTSVMDVESIEQMDEILKLLLKNKQKIVKLKYLSDQGKKMNFERTNVIREYLILFGVEKSRLLFDEEDKKDESGRIGLVMSIEN